MGCLIIMFAVDLFGMKVGVFLSFDTGYFVAGSLLCLSLIMLLSVSIATDCFLGGC